MLTCLLAACWPAPCSACCLACSPACRPCRVFQVLELLRHQGLCRCYLGGMTWGNHNSLAEGALQLDMAMLFLLIIN